mmetsp:Transcript_39184/g.62022  ORF Transcript_39184/g.62022 Transcript_39184/m.62022 type:complete len:113 (+) Transcript_39184:179-517(+)
MQRNSDVASFVHQQTHSVVWLCVGLIGGIDFFVSSVFLSSSIQWEIGSPAFSTSTLGVEVLTRSFFSSVSIAPEKPRYCTSFALESQSKSSQQSDSMSKQLSMTTSKWPFGT